MESEHDETSMGHLAATLRADHRLRREDSRVDRYRDSRSDSRLWDGGEYTSGVGGADHLGAADGCAGPAH
jgi:hypothetical protein